MGRSRVTAHITQRMEPDMRELMRKDFGKGLERSSMVTTRLPTRAGCLRGCLTVRVQCLGEVGSRRRLGWRVLTPTCYDVD